MSGQEAGADRGVVLRRRWNQEPMVQFLGLELLSEGPAIELRMPFRDMLVGNPMLPALHGGTVAALLQFCGTFQLHFLRPELQRVRVVDLHVDYVRSGRTCDTFAAARVVRMGRRVALLQAEAWQGQRSEPIASARLHYVLTDVAGSRSMLVP